jgi:hypothetical protein
MTRAATGEPTEVLAGLVDRVTFHNSENGFCVLRVKARGQRDLITALGHAPVISAGEFVQASGSWVNDRTHGVQFRASFLKAVPPTTTEGIEKYLRSGMMRTGLQSAVTEAGRRCRAAAALGECVSLLPATIGCCWATSIMMIIVIIGGGTTGL